MPVASDPSPAQTAHADFSGLWIPLITPFCNQAIDYDAIKRLLKHYNGTGIAGYVVFGSTGEPAALDKDEQLQVLRTVLANSAGKKIIMGMSGYHLGQACDWVQHISAEPIDGILLPPPHYIRPSQAGLQQWFVTLADHARCPVVVYDIPYRTGSTLALETLLALSDHSNIVAIKDCGGDLSKTQALLADGRLQVLTGEDAQVFQTVAGGGAGAIAASAHLAPRTFAQMLEHLRAQDMEGARALWKRLLPVARAAFHEANPASIKSALAQQGLLHNELRAPMQTALQPFDMALLQGLT